MSTQAFVLTVFFFVVSFAVCPHAHTFCSRSVASRSCPQPPTIDTFNLQAYLGRWYEIGSTARFKLSTEAGVVCDQAVYSSTSGNLHLLNSALQVVRGTRIHHATTAVTAVCAAARDACFQLQAAGQVSHVLQSFNTTQSLELAHQLGSSAQSTALHLQRIAEHVTHIQQVNGQISQANVSSLHSSLAEIEQYVSKARREQGEVAGLVSGLDKVIAQLRGLSLKADNVSVKTKRELEDACSTLSSFAAQLKRSNLAMEGALTALDAEAISSLSSAQPIHNPHVTFVTGAITQPSATAAGKLEVTIDGIRAPYWIIGLQSDSQGNYSAAMVYSCREVAGVSAKSLFVLSKEPQLDRATLQGFLAKAEKLGIYNDCEDPFLLTVQRGGTCGKVPSSSS